MESSFVTVDALGSGCNARTLKAMTRLRACAVGSKSLSVAHAYCAISVVPGSLMQLDELMARFFPLYNKYPYFNDSNTVRKLILRDDLAKCRYMCTIHLFS